MSWEGLDPEVAMANAIIACVHDAGLSGVNHEIGHVDFRDLAVAALQSLAAMAAPRYEVRAPEIAACMKPVPPICEASGLSLPRPMTRAPRIRRRTIPSIRGAMSGRAAVLCATRAGSGRAVRVPGLRRLSARRAAARWLRRSASRACFGVRCRGLGTWINVARATIDEGAGDRSRQSDGASFEAGIIQILDCRSPPSDRTFERSLSR